MSSELIVLDNLPASHGDMADRLTILDIQTERLTSSARRLAAADHYGRLERIWSDARNTLPLRDCQLANTYRKNLYLVNEQLWDIRLRMRRPSADLERDARSLLRLEGERTRLKRLISEVFGSEIPDISLYPENDYYYEG